MPQYHEYYMACWLAGVRPDEIVFPSHRVKEAVVETYVAADRLLDRLLERRKR